MLLMSLRGVFARKLEGITGRLRAVEEYIVREVADSALSHARALTPVRSGRLRGSLRIEAHGGTELHVVMGGSRAPYAPYVEYGTRPHVIRPRRAEALRFEIEGDMVYARLVHHPGTRPMEIMARAADLAMKRVGEIARRLLPSL